MNINVSIPPEHEISQWLDQRHFRRFITLATNRPEWAIGRSSEANAASLKKLLRSWDARINRKVVGSKWASRREDRIWGFYFLEKAQTNPHWHGLIEFFPPYPDALDRQMSLFDSCAAECWIDLMPSGTVDIQTIFDQRRVIDYVVKQIDDDVSYRNFVVPDEF